MKTQNFDSVNDHSLDVIVLQERISQLKTKLTEADKLIRHLNDHEGAEGWSAYLNALLEGWFKDNDLVHSH